MPTLGDLSTTEPIPNGRIQMKRGNPGTGELQWHNAIPPQPLQDGVGNPMRISITPTRPGWWVIHASTIWRMVDAIWSYWHWGVLLTPADTYGDAEDRNHMAMHSAQGFNASNLDTAYHLAADTAYTCDMYWPNSSAGYYNCYWTGGHYHYIIGEFVED